MKKKKYHPFSERLLRFMKSGYPSKKAFADEVGLSPQSFGQNYLKEDPFPGSIFFHHLANMGCDLNWLMTGSGQAPYPMTTQEAEKWIDFCEKQVRYWRSTIELESTFVSEQAALYRVHLDTSPRPSGGAEKPSRKSSRRDH